MLYRIYLLLQAQAVILYAHLPHCFTIMQLMPLNQSYGISVEVGARDEGSKDREAPAWQGS